jgi:biopolymer transport protein ExbB/TolQ
MNDPRLMSEGLMVFLWVLGAVIAILWIIVPFAVFAINDKARRIEKLLREQAERERIRDSQARNTGRL